ncbi:MAG: hypothetical protein CSA18_03555 [Deltaproteobacteria bacterium]|nr:MAG: hypothetical protein CSA18_03555 [Deltaproteobacteria bacterium]
MEWIKNVSLKKKLVGGFLFCSFIVLIVGGIGFIEISKNVRNFQKMVNLDLKEYMCFETLQKLTLQHRRYEKNFFLEIGHREKQQGYLKLFKESSDATIAIMKKIDGLRDDINSEELKNRKIFKKNYLEYKDGFLQIAQKVLADPSITPRYANNVLMEPFKNCGSVVQKSLEKLMKINIEKINRVSYNMVLSGKKAKIIIGILVLIGFVIAFALGLIISRLITIPISLAVSFAQEIARGNISLRVEKKFLSQKDEIGQLANSMDSMARNLWEIFSQISSGANVLSSSSKELDVISDHMSSGSEQTSQKSHLVSSAAEEMSVNMNSVASSMDEASGNLQMIVAAAEELSSTINEVARNMGKGNQITKEAVEQAGGISEKMSTLGKAASEITKVTETISDISEQTNLLALNATIEAARAGEAGKGFAVVAGEIKALAQQTASATGEISNRIANVQGLTSESVTAIESIVSIINEINDIVSSVADGMEEQSATTQDISSNVNQAAQGVQEINENVNQASVVSKEVSSDISEVNILADEMSGYSTRVNTSAVDLSKLSEELNAIVEKFQL